MPLEPRDSDRAARRRRFDRVTRITRITRIRVGVTRTEGARLGSGGPEHSPGLGADQMRELAATVMSLLAKVTRMYEAVDSFPRHHLASIIIRVIGATRI